FALGQVIEGNYLTPKLVGGSVGLHPVWLLLALSVFGALFGFVGMLVAVPVAAALGVVARFLTGQYLHSRLYQGLSHRDSKK
ncbi:MAG: AI-2E family transporter, partial [Pseudomonadota bacterium]|nr:AI-2E family transporter [Pseudomonadota bacterium]